MVGASGGVEAGIGGAGVVVIAVHRGGVASSGHAASSGVALVSWAGRLYIRALPARARVGRASVVIVTVLGSVGAASKVVAGRNVARVGRSTQNRSEHASSGGVAGVGRASVVVVARNRGEDTVSVGSVALLCCADSETIVTHLLRGDATTLRGIALFEGAWVVVGGARDVADDAVTGGVLAVGVLADGRGGAVHRSVLTADGGGHEHSAEIVGARISIITITRLAATLAITLADVTPIVVRAVDLERGGHLNL